MRKKSKNIASLTRLEAEKHSKLLAGQVEEELLTTGQDSEKEAIKAVKELQKEEDKQEKEKREVDRFLLEDARKRRLDYFRALAKTCRQQMQEYDIPKGFAWGAFLRELDKNDCALAVWFRSSRGKRAEVAMKISGEPKYDLNWIDRRVPDVLDLMEKIADSYENPKTKGGVYLPSWVI